MRIAVIPARGGSKRVPRKNIRDFCGRPMIAWSIDAARESGLFDHILVSTEDAEIADIARHWGAEVPFVRPAELSSDHAGTTEVVAHAARWACDQGWPVTAVCCVCATAPFLSVRDIEQGLQAIESGKWEYSFAVTDFASPIFRAFKRHSTGGVEMIFPEHFPTRSQDLPTALHDAGQFYWGRTGAWLEDKQIFAPHSLPIMIPRWRVQDIDSEDDWVRAELVAPAIMKRASQGGRSVP